MEPLLGQIINYISRLAPNVDLVQARVEVAGLLARYEICPVRNMVGHPDIAEKVKLFLSAKKLEGLSPLTLKGYALDIKSFTRFVHKPVNEITTQDIRTYLGQYDYLKLSSIGKKLSVLKSFFGWMTEEEIIERDPTRKIKAPKPPKRLPKALNVEELEMLREACQTPRERALVEVLYATGGRLSEIYRLNKQDIDWQAKSCRVLGKGSKEREVYFGYKALYYLRKYFKTRDDIVPALFITERKPVHRLGRRGIQNEIKKISLRSGIKKNVHPHVMRHTMATLTFNNGADLAMVQSLLGHSNPSTTQIYAQLTDGKRREQYDRYMVQ